MSLSKSSFALQFCVEELIKTARGPVGFYLVTVPEILNWREVSRRHAKMLDRMRTDAAQKRLPRFGGVRVFEEGEVTFRPHAHWVLTPRFTQAQLQHYADLAGMGHVWRDTRPASVRLGAYLSKYLSKQKGRIRGVKRWSCFGEFSGPKVKEIEVSSPEIELFRSHYKTCKLNGLQGAQAYTETVRLCNLSKYGHQLSDSLAGVAPEAIPQTDDEVNAWLERQEEARALGVPDKRIPGEGRIAAEPMPWEKELDTEP